MGSSSGDPPSLTLRVLVLSLFIFLYIFIQPKMVYETSALKENITTKYSIFDKYMVFLFFT